MEKQDDQYDFRLALVKPLSEWLQAFDAKDSDLADQDDQKREGMEGPYVSADSFSLCWPYGVSVTAVEIFCLGARYSARIIRSLHIDLL